LISWADLMTSMAVREMTKRATSLGRDE